MGGLLIVTGSGDVATCPMPGLGADSSHCERVHAPPLPKFENGVATALEVCSSLRAAVKSRDGRVALMELLHDGMDSVWREVGAVSLPQEHEVRALSATPDHLLVSDATGAAYRWSLREGVPTTLSPEHDVPMKSERTWHAACALPDNKIMRLASSWERTSGGALVSQPQLLL